MAPIAWRQNIPDHIISATMQLFALFAKPIVKSAEPKRKLRKFDETSIKP